MNSPTARNSLRCTVFCLILGACSAEPPPASVAEAPRAAVPATATQTPTSIPKPGELPGDIARLIAIANEDFAASRFVSPPAANALEGFLEVRDLDPDNASVRDAMVDLYPLATAAVSAAIAKRDLAEAERVLALVERAMPDALGVAELRADLDGLTTAGSAQQDGAGEASARPEPPAASDAATSAQRPLPRSDAVGSDTEPASPASAPHAAQPTGNTPAP